MDIHAETQKYRDKIKSIASEIEIRYKDRSEKISIANKWIEISENVESISCSLTNNHQTVLNVKFNKSGRIPLHSHDRVETIHIINGEIYESVSKKIYRKGDPPLIILENIEHEIISDNASLIMVFEPPYPWTGEQCGQS